MSSGIAKSLLSSALAFALLLAASAAQAPPLAGAAPRPLHVRSALPGYVRVVLSDDGATQGVGGKLQWLDGTKILGTTDKATDVTLSGELVRVRLGGKARDARRLVAVPVSGYALYGGKSYRGRFELFAGQDGGVVVLNVLPLEEYLQGVVPSEMPSAWAPAALRAQAVAARTYAVARISDRTAETFDVYATVADQAYRGVTGEAESTNHAVRDTAGMVLAYAGEPITAMYCSDAGGCTLQGSAPYLQAVVSYAPESKHNNWQLPVPPDKLKSLAAEDDVQLGSIEMVSAANDPVSGHLLELRVDGSKGTWKIGGKELRKRLGYTTMKSTRVAVYPALSVGDPPAVPQCDASGLAKCYPGSGADGPPTATPDTAIDIGIGTADAPGREALPAKQQQAAGPSVISFGADLLGQGIVLAGCGNGHGVGMSQYGANELAKEGWDYREILLYFYRGVELAQLPAIFLRPDSADEYCEDDATHGSDGAVSVEFYEPYKPRGGKQ